MHLICTASFELEEFTGGSIPHYAIHSHQQISEELSFQDMKSNQPGVLILLPVYLSTCKDLAVAIPTTWVSQCSGVAVVLLHSTDSLTVRD